LSSKAIEKKKQQVEALAEQMRDANSVVLVDYLGLDVSEADALRTRLRENDCRMQVIKNNIIRRAAEAAGYQELTQHVEGPNAVVFSYEDSVSAAKTVYEFAKEHPDIELKAGYVDEEYMDNEYIQKIASIPSREELLTMFAGGLLQPVRNIAIALNMHAENLQEQDNG